MTAIFSPKSTKILEMTGHSCFSFSLPKAGSIDWISSDFPKFHNLILFSLHTRIPKTAKRFRGDFLNLSTPHTERKCWSQKSWGKDFAVDITSLIFQIHRQILLLGWLPLTSENSTNPHIYHAISTIILQQLFAHRYKKTHFFLM